MKDILSVLALTLFAILGVPFIVVWAHTCFELYDRYLEWVIQTVNKNK